MSSSGHLELLPRLLRFERGGLDPELRKSFDVALHAGTAAALALALRSEVAEVVRGLDRQRLLAVALTFAPAGVAGALFERRVERRLGSRRSVALAQIGAGVALAAADQRRAVRSQSDARALDHLLIGAAQAAALVPGVSRGGATLTAARSLGFERRAASVLSRHAAFPVIGGATALKGLRLARRGLDRELRRPFAAGAVAAFASTLASAPLVGRMDRARSYLPIAAYRVALGALALFTG